jgi:hypothetical protein
MNITAIDNITFSETITSDCFEILHIVEVPGTAQTYVAVLDGVDVLIVTDAMTGGAIVITDHDQDHESGYSIHDHARLTN